MVDLTASGNNENEQVVTPTPKDSNTCINIDSENKEVCIQLTHILYI